jgi:hypothetical protein
VTCVTDGERGAYCILAFVPYSWARLLEHDRVYDPVKIDRKIDMVVKNADLYSSTVQ